MPANNNQRKKPRQIRSFETTDKILKLLKLAMQSSGKTLSQLISDALDEHLEDVVHKTLKERDRALVKFKAAWKKRKSQRRS